MRRAASGESAACCEQASIIDTDRLSGQEERRGQARRQPTDSCRTARGSGMPPAGSARQGVNGGRDGRIRRRTCRAATRHAGGMCGGGPAAARRAERLAAARNAAGEPAAAGLQAGRHPTSDGLACCCKAGRRLACGGWDCGCKAGCVRRSGSYNFYMPCE